MITDISQMVEHAIGEVFGTMLNMRIEKKPEVALSSNGGVHVASAVGFIGRATGVVYFYASAEFARRITSGLLGLEEKDVDSDEMVNDAMGELANMVVGQIKSRLSDRGMPCVLTIPSIVRGSHFTIEPVSSTERYVLGFLCRADPMVVEVLLKPGSHNPSSSSSE